MIKAMRKVKLIEKRKPMKLLGLEKNFDRLAKGNKMRWYGHVLRRNKDNVLRRTLDLKWLGDDVGDQRSLGERR